MSTAPSMETNNLRAFALGLGFGGLTMIFFGLAWWGIASTGIENSVQLLYWGFIDLIALALLAITLVLILTIWRLPIDTSPESIAHGKTIGKQLGKRSGLIFGLEVVIAATVYLILDVVNHPEFFFPLLAIVVGAHFFPLAVIFRVLTYYITGFLMCLAGVVSLFLTSSTTMLGSLRAWDVLPGLVCGSILWLTAIADLTQAYRVLKQVRTLLKG